MTEIKLVLSSTSSLFEVQEQEDIGIIISTVRGAFWNKDDALLFMKAFEARE